MLINMQHMYMIGFYNNTLHKQIAKLEQKTSEMSIANTSEMQIENLSVIPEDEQTPHTEIDPTTAVVAYSERSPVDSIHHYTPAYPVGATAKI